MLVVVSCQVFVCVCVFQGKCVRLMVGKKARWEACWPNSGQFWSPVKHPIISKLDLVLLCDLSYLLMGETSFNNWVIKVIFTVIIIKNTIPNEV